MRIFRHILVVGFLAFASIFAWVAWWPHSELTAAGLHTEAGKTSSGSKFGVRPGMSWREADQIIRSQFNPTNVMWIGGTEAVLARGGGTYLSAPLLTGRAEVSYRDRSWRNGSIALVLVDGVVTEVRWWFGGPFDIAL